MTEEQSEEIKDIPPLEVIVTNHPEIKEKPDNTSWEEKDPWDFVTMTEEDIKQAEESRNA